MMSLSRILAVLGASVAFATAVLMLVPPERAYPQGAEESGAAWRVEQPKPPPPPPGVPGSSVPIGLGKIGDIEFWAPNRGLLITAGNPPTIPPGVWAYNGQRWYELATVCGAADGRIAWAGPEEFWTVSNGRPGQATESELGGQPPLDDNTLCHFSGGQVLASYAHPAFQADSYQAMHAAGCITASDCWFAGDPLPEPQIGAFQLHWNGSSLEAEPYLGEAHAVQDMRPLEGHLYESVRLSSGDREVEEKAKPPAVHRINPKGVRPTLEPEEGLPLYGPGELPTELDFLHLSAGERALWGAAGSRGSESANATLTVVHRAEGEWAQLIGPAHLLEAHLFAEEASLFPEGAASSVATSIAAEPGTGSAWLGLTSQTDFERLSPGARAAVARVSAEGEVTEAQTLPSAQERHEGVGPKGAAAKMACPAPHDCWLATTQGWLFHLAPAGERTLPEDADPAFASLITYRPPDEGLPQVPPDAPPPDDSGLVEEPPTYGGAFAESSSASTKQEITVPLLSNLHSRLVHGSTLELRFHLAGKAHVRLLAKRRKKLVASTSMRTLAAGNRKLLLRLNLHNWPTKLDLQTHALAPLPTVTVNQPVGGPEHGSVGANTVGTDLRVLPHVPSFTGSGSLP
jgi:hypothetical protein